MTERCEPDLNRRMTVLQTGALPLGYRTIFDCNDSNGNRTRVTAVKGRCLNRLTMEPRFHAFSGFDNWYSSIIERFWQEDFAIYTNLKLQTAEKSCCIRSSAV